MIRRAHEPVAAILFFLVGVIAYVILGGGAMVEDTGWFWLVFAGMTLLAFPIGYFTRRYFYLVGLTPCAGLIIAYIIDNVSDNLWQFVTGIVFWALILLPAFGLSWAGHGLRVHKRREAKRQFMFVLLTVVNAIVFLIYTVPLIFFGVLGVRGNLAYTEGYPEVGWIILAAAAVGLIFHAVSAYWIVHTIRKHRRLQGHCPKCNYNLRGEMKQGCPECGWNRDTVINNT